MEKLAQILELPESCMVNKKITKAFFKRNFELTISEIKLLDDFSSIIQMDWLASLKPENINIATYNDAESIFEEVIIMSVQIGEADFNRNIQKIAELIQKYIPYHILLCIYNSSYFALNTCCKRINLNDASKRTVERHYLSASINQAGASDKQKSFIKSLAFAELEKLDLKTLYDSYTNRIIALHTADVNGIFTIQRNKRSKQDMFYLENISRLRSDILTLQNQAIKETQLQTQVLLNADIQEKRKQIKKLEELISS